ncbi:MAG: cell division protein FtsA [Candidatus Firestonebacteria bacterium]|nr:cell division protein FtsA [Candidatus Firestonebacteria bacterium]
MRKSFSNEDLVIGLDIGTTKICIVISKLTTDGKIEIIGLGTCPSKGLRKGVVVNLESTVKSIEKALEDAELMAGISISKVFTGIAGGHIKSINSRGVIAVSGRDKVITQADVDRVIDAARAVAIPMDREVIHVLTQEFILDDQEGIKDPVGMVGVRLESEVHIVTGAVTSAQNIIRSVNRAGLEVEDIVLEPLASSCAVLDDNEKELGVILIDIGGGTTDMAIFSNGAIKHTYVLALGGDHVTNDIAVGLRTPNASAENIKKQYGCALTGMINQDEEIEVPSVGGRPDRKISRKILGEIIEPRMEELFTLVNRELKRTGLNEMAAAGVVLTGGASLMEGTVQMAEKIFEMPVRLGYPQGVTGLIDVINNPIFSTAVGLILYGVKNRSLNKPGRFRGYHLFNKVSNRMKEWFGEFF